MLYPEFFSYSVHVNESIDEYIERYNSSPIETQNDWKEFYHDVLSCKQRGETTIMNWQIWVLDSKHKIPLFYGSKFDDYQKQLPESTEEDFVDDSLKECETMLPGLEKRIAEFKSKQFDVLHGINHLTEFKRELFLLKKYIEYLKLRKSQLPEISPGVRLVICAREFGQMYNYTLKYINDNIKRIIQNEFNEFDTKYNTTWSAGIEDILRNITNHQYHINIAATQSNQDRLDCYLNLQSYKVHILKYELERLHVFFAEVHKKDANDVVRLVNTFNVLMVKYKYLVSSQGCNAEKNYFFPDIIGFYEKMKTEYGFANSNSQSIALFHAQPTEMKEHSKPKLKIRQIALIYVYEQKQITRVNADEIAKDHGHNSGEKLFQIYTTYCTTSNRKEKPTPCTPKRLTNKIKLFESIIEHLSDKAKKRANDEIKILQTLFESEYE